MCVSFWVWQSCLQELFVSSQSPMGERASRSEVKGDEITTCAMGDVAMGTPGAQRVNDFLFESLKRWETWISTFFISYFSLFSLTDVWSISQFDTLANKQLVEQYLLQHCWMALRKTASYGDDSAWRCSSRYLLQMMLFFAESEPDSVFVTLMRGVHTVRVDGQRFPDFAFLMWRCLSCSHHHHSAAVYTYPDKNVKDACLFFK